MAGKFHPENLVRFWFKLHRFQIPLIYEIIMAFKRGVEAV